MSAAKKLVAGNWKMNGMRAQMREVESLVDALRAEPPGCRVAVMPPATLILSVVKRSEGLIEVGAQDVHFEAGGAWTGDLSAEMLQDAGATLVIVGHSERRQGYGETDATVASKVRAAIRGGLEPIVCVGETGEERDGGRTLEVVRAQARGSLPEELEGRRFSIAYEPVWAIGTGRTPTHDQIVEVHEALLEVAERFGGSGRVLYGGSVKPENAAELMALPGVGGALVGGASLRAKDFLPIVYAAA